MTEFQNVLPVGWDCRIDQKTGKTYYINHYTKITTWDDPRMKNSPFGKHHIPLHKPQSNDHITQHGSPDLRKNYVYPSQPSPIPAFQIPGQYSPKYVPLQDLKTSSRMSPLLLRTSQTQESSLTNVPDTVDSVAKISAMFPTVSDTHIRLLLKKYHGREAVVISALQVEKHPITTPGPFATPPPSRNIYPGLNSSLQMTPPLGSRSYSRGGSPITRFGSITTDSPRIGDGFRNSSRPHSSPKLKLRYMKCIFPKAEETVILDVLTNSDNNIQKASDWLKRMGYERKDPIKIQQQAEATKLEEERQRNEELLRADVPQLPKIKSTEEKAAIKARLQEQYKDIMEQVITIALDSVQYDEDRASQILQIMVQEDSKTQSSSSFKSEEAEASAEASETDDGLLETMPTSHSRHSFKSLMNSERNDNSKDKGNFKNDEDAKKAEFKSSLLTITQGANPDIVKGADGKHLLMDYIPWQGSNAKLRQGPQKNLAKGPNRDNLSDKKYKPHGANPELYKGAKPGLAKGSIFQQLRNIVNSESRGK